MKTHHLKTWPEYFEAVFQKRKTFEIRRNDRDFKVGDWVILEEWDYVNSLYTGRQTIREIKYITNFGQVENFVVFSLGHIEPGKKGE